MTRIGDQLVRRGLIDTEALEKALRQQADEGGYLGQHLVDGGFISRQQFYDGLARQWDLPRRDLDLEPPDRDLIGRVDLERDLELGWVPCEIAADGELVVATSVRPGPDLVEEVHEQFPALPVRFVVCTRRDLDHLALRSRRTRRSVRPAPVPAQRPSWCGSLVVRDLLGGLIATLVLTVAVAAPPTVLSDVLVVSGALFLAAVVVQAGLAVRTAVLGDGAGSGGAARDGARADSAVLPTYSILVPVEREDDVARALDLLAAIDYPSSRTDAILLVRGDGTLAAVRRAAPPSWIRVATLPPDVAADPVAVYDEGLALARGRHVVAYSPEESPEPDQLLRAVAAFEQDLEENLGTRHGRQPLAGLRVARRRGGHRWSTVTSLDDLDHTLVLDRACPWHGPGVDLGSEPTSVHFNTRVLRRLGGWRELAAAEPGTAVPRARMARLDSETRLQRGPGPRALVRERARSVVRSVRIAEERVRQLGTRRTSEAPRLGEVAMGFLSLALLLCYPIGWGTSGVFLLRRAEAAPGELEDGLVGLAVWGLGLLLAMGAAGVLGARRQGWRALGPALLLPALWLVDAAAAWYAVLVLLPCHRPDGPAAPVADASGQRA